MDLYTFTAGFVWIFAGGLAAIVAWRLLTGSMGARGLLASGNDAQLLMVTGAAAAAYLYEISRAPDCKFPPVDTLLLVLFVSSNAAYALPRALQLISNPGRNRR